MNELIKNNFKNLIFPLLVVGLLCFSGASAAQAENISVGGNLEADSSANGKTVTQEKGPDNDARSGPAQTAEQLGLKGVSSYIYNIMIGLGGIFVYLGGKALDLSLGLLVVGMGQFILNNMIVAIDELWTIMRDLFNILFIFGLIYIGFKTILGSDETGTRRVLVSLIAAALLINFSLLATKSIVDFSNLAANQVYHLLGAADAEYQVVSGSEYVVTGIAGSFLQIADLSSYANTETKQSLHKMTFGQVFTYAFLVMCMMLMAAFVFLAGAFVMVSRFIILVFSMIFSPFMFLGWVFPQLSGFASSWWQKFLSNAFLAPAYLFMVFLSLKVLQSINTSGSIFEASQNGNIGVLLIFCVVIGFLYGSLLVAQKMGGAGSNLAMKAAHAVRKRAQVVAGGVIAGGAARAGRGLVGQAAQRLSERSALLDKASKGGFGGWAARQSLKSLRTVGDSSFDVRRVAGVGEALGVGEGKKGGYKTTRDAVIKKEKEFASSLGEVGDDDPKVYERNKRVAEAKEELKRVKSTKGASRAEIFEAEEKLREAEVAQKQEKQRRQTGSVEYAQERKKYKDQATTIKVNITSLQNQQKADGVSQEKVKELARDISSERKKLAKLQEEFDKLEGGGYAAVVEEAGWKSLLEGRTPHQNREAGESIRKEYEKKIKRTKEDERTDSLREEIGKSGKKDE